MRSTRFAVTASGVAAVDRAAAGLAAATAKLDGSEAADVSSSAWLITPERTNVTARSTPAERLGGMCARKTNPTGLSDLRRPVVPSIDWLPTRLEGQLHRPAGSAEAQDLRPEHPGDGIGARVGVVHSVGPGAEVDRAAHVVRDR